MAVGGQDGSYDDRDSYLLVPIDWDQGSHQLDDANREEWVQGAVVDTQRLSMEHLDSGEAGLAELVDEVGFCQGPGDASGPGGGLGQDLGRQVVLADGQVGHAQASSGPEHARTLGQYPG